MSSTIICECGRYIEFKHAHIILMSTDKPSINARALKLMDEHKDFIVISEDEPYYLEVYDRIREIETLKGSWSATDEREYQAAVVKKALEI